MNFDRPPAGPADSGAEHYIDPEIRAVDIDAISRAFDAIADNDVAIRYVIDNTTLPTSGI